MLTRGEGGGEGGVDGVVVEREEGEVGEAAEDGGERAGEVFAGEVDGVNDVGGGVAFDARPGARRDVVVVP